MSSAPVSSTPLYSFPMNNLLLDMKKIVEDGKRDGHAPELIRVELKEYLQYFVLDFLYNSEFKAFTFYGGSCLRVVYKLPRMSEDLDFEVEEGSTDLPALADALGHYFKSVLVLKNVKIAPNIRKDVIRIVLSFPIAKDVGLSPHDDETIKIKIEIRIVPTAYAKKIKPILTPLSKFGKAFVLRHYDLPTLMAGKLSAILTRPLKGFAKGPPEEEYRFKGRDFYDLLWYMEKSIQPNLEMLRTNGITGTVKEIFDPIAAQIAGMNVKGIEKDIEYLFAQPNYVKNWVQAFRETFNRLKEEKYDIS